MVQEFLGHIHPGWLLAGLNIFGLLVALRYFRSLHRPAQDAAFFALPRRRFLERTRTGQRALSFFMPADAAAEHHLGYIELEDFNAREMAPNPMIRRELWARGAKRAAGIAVSFALILFMLPVLVATAIAIRLESPGPVFYRQRRVGRDGKIFRVYKFRSMTVNAEKNGAQWAGQNDARVTRVGQFIRKTRIDEIPQTLNILFGDMNFVGPRPERPEFTEMLAQEIPHYNERHQVKPGLTGWAQVNYPYGASVEDARQKLKYDLYYLKNYSLVLDLFIVIKTIKVALLGIGSR